MVLDREALRDVMNQMARQSNPPVSKLGQGRSHQHIGSINSLVARIVWSHLVFIDDL